MHWLINDTRDERFVDNIFAELCVRLQRAGIPVKRATLHIMINHPQWLGARFVWADGMDEVEIARVAYDVRERSEYTARVWNAARVRRSDSSAAICSTYCDALLAILLNRVDPSGRCSVDNTSDAIS